MKKSKTTKKKSSASTLKSGETAGVSRAAGKSKSGAAAAMPPGLIKRVLFRPDRFEYVRHNKTTHACVFCEASAAHPGFETLCVYKTEHTMIILNKFPYNSGHLLVLPRHHKGHLLKLSDIEYQDLHQTLKVAVLASEKLYQPPAMNIGLNHGKAAGAGLPEHLHYHLIPRWEGDLNFFPLIAETKVVVESLEQTYEKFSKYFSEIKT